MASEVEARSEFATLKAGLDHIDQGISVFDERLRLVFCNQRYLDLLELPKELAVVGSSYADFVRFNAERGEYGDGSIEQQISERVEAAQNFIAHYQEQTRPNGVVLAIHGVPLPEGGFISVYSDITEQQRAEELIRERNEELEARVQRRTQELQRANEQLRDLVKSEQSISEALKYSEARLRLITDAVPAGIAYIDAHQRYQFANDRIARAFGYTKEDIIGKTTREVLGEKLYDQLIPFLEKGQMGEEVTFEYTLGLPDGRNALIRTNIITDLETDHAFPGYYVLSLDVSDQKKAETALAHAQKMEAVAELSGGLAHDFNNLLTVVLGNLLPLRERSRGADAELVDPAIEAARRGTKLIRRLLSFSRQEMLEPAPVKVEALIESLVGLLKSTLPKEIAIVSETEDRDLLAFVDLHQLENALLNLCFNARDAMPGGGTLRVTAGLESIAEGARTEVELPTGRYVAISVVDDGSGMDQATVDRVFEPFFTSKEAGQGTGLGLSMVYGFAKQSGGAVALDSAVGQGTQVRLLLPCAEAAIASTEQGATREDSAERTLVLLVDDDHDVREVIRRQLIELGFVTIEAANADEALGLLSSVDEIALLLSDVVMPGGMNGYDLAQRALERRPDVKVLLMSAFTEGKTRGGAEPPMPVLRKPFEAHELHRAIRSRLQNDGPVTEK